MDLLLKPPPLPDEGPYAYLTRLAESNLLTIRQLRDLNVFPGEGTARVTASSNPGTAGLLAAFGPMHLRQGWQKPNASVCPNCLSEQTYGRIAWEVPYVSACPVHRSWLIDACSACRRFIPLARSYVAMCPCGHDLRLERTRLAPDSVVALSCSLVSALMGNDEHILPILSNLSLVKCLRLISFLVRYGTEQFVPSRPGPGKSVSDPFSWAGASYAAELLVNWPNGFGQMLRKNQVESSQIYSAFPNLYEALYTQLADPAFSFVRMEFENYIAENWQGVIARRNKRVSMKLPERMTWLPTAYLHRTTGLSQRHIRHLATCMQIRSYVHRTRSGRQFQLVNSVDLREFIKSECSQHVNLEVCAAKLGLSRRRLRTAISTLFPNAKRLPAGEWLISKNAVTLAQSKIARIPIVTNALDLERYSSVDFLLRYRAWSTNVAAQFLSDLLNGNDALKRIRIEACSNFRGIAVTKESVEQWENLLALGGRTGISIPEVASLLEIKQQVAYFLIRKGFLGCTIIKGQRRREARVSSEDIASFRDNYAFGRDYAKRLGCSPNALMHRLRKVGVDPASGPGVDAGRQLIYRREAIVEALMRGGEA
jgi:hypothetical protein